jgi:hypothetical protein
MSKDEEFALWLYKSAFENGRLKYALKMILQDLPAKRDWLNPDIEKMARELISEKSS